VPSPADNFATPRVAAGALFVKNDQVLLVRKTYGERWDIPGGYVDRGESPAEACRRELREELGLDRKIGRLLVMDWAPHDNEGDKILFVFDGGSLDDDGASITLDHDELDSWSWVQVEELGTYLNERLTPRLTCAYRAHRTGTMLSLEHGISTTP
jgi:8-oxo-dGTP pyrophosphatase MutT (NUDIX family)